MLVGAAPGFYPALCMGAVGGIVAVACVLPELCVRLHTLTREGRHTEARALQRQLTPLGRLVTTTYGVPGLKAAMDVAGFSGGEPRAPLARVSPEVWKKSAPKWAGSWRSHESTRTAAARTRSESCLPRVMQALAVPDCQPPGSGDDGAAR